MPSLLCIRYGYSYCLLLVRFSSPMKPSPRSIQRTIGKVRPASSESATATGQRRPGQAALPGLGSGVQVGL